jgi:uncharacterized membrane-anchored protein YhcB (DUF1043 family)
LDKITLLLKIIIWRIIMARGLKTIRNEISGLEERISQLPAAGLESKADLQKKLIEVYRELFENSEFKSKEPKGGDQKESTAEKREIEKLKIRAGLIEDFEKFRNLEVELSLEKDLVVLERLGNLYYACGQYAEAHGIYEIGFSLTQNGKFKALVSRAYQAGWKKNRGEDDKKNREQMPQLERQLEKTQQQLEKTQQQLREALEEVIKLKRMLQQETLKTNLSDSQTALASAILQALPLPPPAARCMVAEEEAPPKKYRREEMAGDQTSGLPYQQPGVPVPYYDQQWQVPSSFLPPAAHNFMQPPYPYAPYQSRPQDGPPPYEAQLRWGVQPPAMPLFAGTGSSLFSRSGVPFTAPVPGTLYRPSFSDEPS